MSGHSRDHVHIAQSMLRLLNGRTVLVQGAAGAVGVCAVRSRVSGARVIGTVRSSSDAVHSKEDRRSRSGCQR